MPLHFVFLGLFLSWPASGNFLILMRHVLESYLADTKTAERGQLTQEPSVGKCQCLSLSQAAALVLIVPCQHLTSHAVIKSLLSFKTLTSVDTATVRKGYWLSPLPNECAPSPWMETVLPASASQHGPI